MTSSLCYITVLYSDIVLCHIVLKYVFIFLTFNLVFTRLGTYRLLYLIHITPILRVHDVFSYCGSGTVGRILEVAGQARHDHINLEHDCTLSDFHHIALSVSPSLTPLFNVKHRKDGRRRENVLKELSRKVLYNITKK